MTVAVKRINNQTIAVNGQRMKKDTAGEWRGGAKLNSTERNVATAYISSLEKFIENKKK